MADFIADASATLPWCLKDEETAWTVALLNRLGNGDRLTAPAHWIVEVANSLVMAARRGRIPADRVTSFLAELGDLPVTMQLPLTFAAAAAAVRLSQKHRLTIYDAVYLELASRLALPLATLDSDLASACRAEGVFLL